MELNVVQHINGIVKMNYDKILNCKHEWETETEDGITITWCPKCDVSKRELKKIKEELKNKKLSDY